MRIRRKRIREIYGPSRFRSMVMLPQYNVCYVPVPKTGCSSVKLWLERIYTDSPDLEEDENIHIDRTTPNPRDVTWPIVREMERNGLFGFTIVRDPIHRALSAFSEKMPRDVYRQKINEALGRTDLAAPVSLDDFIHGLELMEPLKMDPHWRPQHMVAMMDGMTYDHIGKLETLAADLQQISDKSGLPSVDIPWLNAGPRRDDVALTGSQRTKLEQIYRRDFEQFGY